MSRGNSSFGGIRKKFQSSSGDKAGQDMALVKWLSGKEAGRFTHNVNLEWIMNFDPLSDFREESHLVEWRTMPKPKNGWEVCDCQVLEVSSDPDFLLQRMQEEKEKALSKDSEGRKSHERTSTSTPRRSNSESSTEDIQKMFKSFLSQISGNATPPSNVLSLNTEENQVKVGEALTLSQTAYMEAKLARTPSSMTMDLVRATFSVKRLRRSSYAGQRRTINGNVMQKPSLKRYRKMKDIQNFVNQRFPHFNQSAFGHAVNAVTGSNVDKRPPKELVDQSSSEEDE